MRCTCFAVLHLLPHAQQEADAGSAVFEMPVQSPQRAPKPWSVVATRTLGRLRVERHTQIESRAQGRWITRWQCEDFAGFDRSAYVPGQSRVRLVVATAVSRGNVAVPLP